MVLEIDEDRRRISLGMKQCMANPWEDFSTNFKKGDKVSGGITRAVEIGAVDEIIEPNKTRSALAKAISEAPHRRGSHGNIPL